MNRVVQFALNTALPVAMIVGTVAVGQVLLESRERPVRPAEERAALLVEVTEAVPVTEAVAYESQGTVIPARQVALQALVSGPATRVHSQLVVGGLLEEGATLLRVDPADYQLAIAEAEAAVTQAETQLQLERGRQDIAQREWALFEEASGTQNVDNRRALATREPQLASARVTLEAAETRLRRAQLNYRRTRLEAPFASLVRAESVENGQLVGPGAAVATLVDTSAFWIEVPIPSQQLSSVRVPGLNSDVGSQVTVRFSVGAQQVEREGR
ncbi:MAG: multidrug resistance efflux pump, partial [Bradymonadia bacterium]